MIFFPEIKDFTYYNRGVNIPQITVFEHLIDFTTLKYSEGFKEQFFTKHGKPGKKPVFYYTHYLCGKEIKPTGQNYKASVLQGFDFQPNVAYLAMHIPFCLKFGIIKTVAMTREKILNHKYREILSGCDLLDTLNKETSDAFLGLFREENWPKNSCILNKEKLSLKFHIILSGRIKMYQIDPFSGKELTLFLLSKGDFFDLFCLLDGCPHTIYYECLDEVCILEAPMENLKNWLIKNPNKYKNFLPYAGKQLRILENSLFEMTFNDISTRLLKLLIKNVNKKSQDLEFIHDLPDKEIAHLLGSTRAVINRHLQALKNNGSIKLSRNKMEVQDLGILLHMLNSQKIDSIL